MCFQEHKGATCSFTRAVLTHERSSIHSPHLAYEAARQQIDKMTGGTAFPSPLALGGLTDKTKSIPAPELGLAQAFEDHFAKASSAVADVVSTKILASSLSIDALSGSSLMSYAWSTAQELGTRVQTNKWCAFFIPSPASCGCQVIDFSSTSSRDQYQ